MTNEALSVVRIAFEIGWKLCTSWYVPGTNVTMGMWLWAFLLIALFGRFISVVLYPINLTVQNRVARRFDAYLDAHSAPPQLPSASPVAGYLESGGMKAKRRWRFYRH